MSIGYKPPIGPLPFEFSTQGYSAPTNILFNFKAKGDFGDLRAAVNVMQVDPNPTYSYVKSCPKYVIGYNSGAVQVMYGKCLYGGIRSLQSAVYAFHKNDLSIDIGAHAPVDLTSRIVSLTHSYSNILASVRGFTFKELMAVMKGGHYPIDLYSSIFVMQKSFTDLNSFIHAWHKNDLYSSINPLLFSDLSVDVVLIQPGELSAYLNIISVYNLPASLYSWQIKDLNAVLNQMFAYDISANIYGRDDMYKNLSARLKGYVSAFSDLLSLIGGVVFEDLQGLIRAKYFRNITAYLYPIQPENIQASLYAYHVKYLQGTVTGNDYPYNLTAYINIVGYYNNLQATIKCIKTYKNLSSSICALHIFGLNASIIPVGSEALYAYLNSVGYSKDLNSSIYPKTVRLTTVVKVPLMEYSNISGAINVSCLFSTYKNLAASIYTVYKSELSSFINGRVPFSTKNLGAKIGYTNTFTETDKIPLNITIYPSSYYSTDKLVLNMLILRSQSINASIRGTLLYNSLQASIYATQLVKYTYEDPLKNREKVISLSYDGLFQSFQVVEMAFKSIVRDYYYSSAGDGVWKVNRLDKWMLEIYGYLPADTALKLKRRLHRATTLYDLRKFNSVDDAVKFAINYVTMYPTHDVQAVINGVGNHASLGGSIFVKSIGHSQASVAGVLTPMSDKLVVVDASYGNVEYASTDLTKLYYDYFYGVIMGTDPNLATKGYLLGRRLDTSGLYGFIFNSETLFPISLSLIDKIFYNGGGYRSSSLNSILKGYVVGSVYNNNNHYYASNTISSIDFSTEYCETIRTMLSEAKGEQAGINSSTIGFTMGGTIEDGIQYTDTIEGLFFNTDTNVVFEGTLSSAKGGGTGIDSDTKGYILGGFISAGNSINIIENFTFKTKLSSVITETLSIPRFRGTGLNSTTNGYILGGNTFASVKYTNIIERISFNSESINTIESTLVGDTACAPGLNRSNAKGYVFGINTGNYSYVAVDLNFYIETSNIIYSVINSDLSISYVGVEPHNVSEEISISYSYLFGSVMPNNPLYRQNKGFILTGLIEGINFVTEESFILNCATSLGRFYVGGPGVNSKTKGYVKYALSLNGFSQPYYEEYGIINSNTIDFYAIDAFDFSTEVSVTITVLAENYPYTNTTFDRGAGVNSTVKGYFMGGSSGVGINVIYSLNFNAETFNKLYATLDLSRYGNVGVSSITKGYCIGGRQNGYYYFFSSIEDMNFSTETSTYLYTSFNTGRCFCSAVSGPNKGYILGGYTGGGSQGVLSSSIESLDFSNETTAVVASTLSQSNAFGTGLNCTTNGFVAGGSINGYSIEKFDFTTEICNMLSTTLYEPRTDGAGVSQVKSPWISFVENIQGEIKPVVSYYEDLQSSISTPHSDLQGLITPLSFDFILYLNFEGVDGATTWVEDPSNPPPDPDSIINIEIDTSEFYSGASSLKFVGVTGYSSCIDYPITGLQPAFKYTVYFMFSNIYNWIDVLYFYNQGNSYPWLDCCIYVDSGSLFWLAAGRDNLHNALSEFNEVCTLAPNTWHKTELIVNNRDISIKINDVLLTSWVAIIDTPLSNINFMGLDNGNQEIGNDMWVDQVELINT